jgi:beta-lactamase regulating signal transducer with metallopeptidase domain
MMALTFSQIAYPLAWRLTLTLIHVLWIGAAIAALAIFVDRILANGTSDSGSNDGGSANTRTRYWLNMTALVTLAATLPITFLVVRDSAAQFDNSPSSLMVEAVEPESSIPIANAQLSNSESDETSTAKSESTTGDPASTLSVTQVQPGEDAAPLIDSVLSQLRTVAPVIALVYLAGVLTMLVRLAVAFCGGQRLTSHGQPVTDQSILDVVATQAERLALKAVPMVAYCERVAVPVVVGVLKPVILLPAAMMSGLSSQELAAVLAHELAHVKRFDHVLIVVQRFLEAVLFFHPAVWWFGRRIHDLREDACDDLVIQGGTDRMDYARSLLRVAEMRVGDDSREAQLAQLAVDGGDPSKLRQRIQRIVQSNDEPGVRLNQSRATFALVASAMAIALSLVPVLPGISDKPVDAAASQFLAEESSTNQESAGDDTEEERSSIKQKLEEPAELHVEKMPLIAVLDAVEKLSGISVTVDLGHFRMRDVDPQTPITLDLEDVTVRALFEEIVKQAHLTFEVGSDGVLIPANTPALELRIVPELPDSEAKIRVPEDWEKSHYRDGTVEGMGDAKDKDFAWFPLQKKKQDPVDVPVSGVNGNFSFGLLSDSPDQVLTADSSWHVQNVEIQDDDFGRRNVRVNLDQLGGLHLQRLSKTSLNQQLAIIVNGVVISAPIVRSEIGRAFTITGNFSDDELTMIADGIRGAMVPPGKELTYKCDVMDEKSGEPVSEAKVLWRVRRTSFKQDERPLFEQRFTTDKNGRYTVQLPREAFEFAQLSIEFEVQHPDYLPVKNVGTRLTLPDAWKPAWSDLRHLKILRGVPVTGRFVNPDGSPAANLPLMISRSRDAPGAGFRGDVIGRTDADGRYDIVTTASWPKRLHWFPEDFVSDSVALKKATDSPNPITFGEQKTIRLKNGPRLSGRVVDPAGKGLSGIYVEAFTGKTVPVLHAMSGAGGHFKFTPSPPGEYRVYTTDGFIDPITEKYLGNTLTRPFTGVTIQLPKTGEPEPVIIRQAASDPITVTAYDEDGAPAINMSFWTGVEPYRSATSEPIEGQPGKYRLWIRRGRSGGTLTTNRSYETATVWQRTADSSPAPGQDLYLGKVKRKGEEVVVRFRQSATIRLIVKAGEKVVPWDARSLNVKYARAAEFEKLGVRHPGFAISVPKQGPEHIIQRVAPDEDVIIDVGVKGELRKQQTIRVGAGESKTITIDLAAVETAANVGIDVELRNAIKAKEATEREYAMTITSIGLVPEVEIRKVRLAVEIATLRIELLEKAGSSAVLRNDVKLRYAIKLKEFAEADYEMSLAANFKVPGTVPEVELRKLKLAVEQTDVQIELAENTKASLAQPGTNSKEADESKAEQPNFAALSVKYDVSESDKEAKIILQNTGIPNGEIGSVQRGMMRHTPVKKGESFQLNKLVPGKYQVARYREVEIITLVGKENDPKGPRVNSGVYIDRMQFSLKSGESKSIVFERPKGQRVKGQIANVGEFKPNRTIVEICSPNAKDDNVGRGLEVTVFDAQQCNDGKFETDALAPGKYKAIVTGYEAWTEQQMFRSGIQRPPFIGSVEFTVPSNGKVEPIEIKLRDAFKKAD